jgi:hypothetical protein
MVDSRRVKYLFLNLSLPAYKVLQVAIIGALVFGGIASFVWLRASDEWYLRYLWLICLVGAAAETVETAIALRRYVTEEPSEPHDSGDALEEQAEDRP